MGNARRTDVRISFDGTDISGEIGEYLISLSFVDNEEDEADDLQLTLHDRDGIWLQEWLSGMIHAAGSEYKRGDTLPDRINGMEASIRTTDADGNESITDCGFFRLDTVKVSSAASTVIIKGISLGYTGIRKTENDKAWENYSLKGIAEEIAEKAGLGVLYECDSDPAYKRLEQAKQTDIAFLKKLCQDAGYSLKIAANKIVIFDQRKYEKIDAATTIRFGDGSYSKYNLSTTDGDVAYAMCVVRYADPATGKVIEGKAYSEDYDEESEENEILRITGQKVSSQREAEELAANALKLRNKFERSASFTMPGSPLLCAGLTVQLEGFGFWNGKYMISSAKHDVGTSGYSTQISLRKVPDTLQQQEEIKTDYKVGDVVSFHGGYHYKSSTRSSPTGGERTAGLAKITRIAEGAKHPYHLIGGRYNSLEGECNVYGWVDAGTFS